jgi:cytochrome c
MSDHALDATPMSTLRRLLRFLLLPALLIVGAGGLTATQPQAPRVLVFSKTAAFRHASIEAGVAALKQLGQANGFAVDATEDAAAFSEGNLRRYRAVVFMSTTGDVLDARQQGAFERYIQAGGGWVGVHSATDTEYDWPWYGRLSGARFASHPDAPNVRKGAFRVRDRRHPATEGLPDRWEREDEFYNFRDIAPGLRVLLDIDESSYRGGTNGANHPMAWYHEVDGGRAFYTAVGHTSESFADPLVLRHLLGGLRWAMGG